jgi:hypothetical protein
MTYDQLTKVKKNYTSWILSQPHCKELTIAKNSTGDWSLCVVHEPTITSQGKRKIAIEMGGLPVMFTPVVFASTSKP